MYDKALHGFCSEFYTLAQSTMIVVNWADRPTTIRIDIFKDEKATKPEYVSHAYRLEHVTLQPTYPQENDKYTSKPKDFQVWVAHETPWVNGNSAEQALRETLGFIQESCT
jgi:hypothetical protein